MKSQISMNIRAIADALREIFFIKPPQFPPLYNKDAIERQVVARFSSGNIRLQQGQYITREEIDEGLQRARENARKYGD